MKGNLKKVAITVGLSAVILLGASIPVVKMINNHKQQLAIEAAAQEKKRKEEEEAKKPIIGVNKEGQKYTYDAKKVQEKLSKYDYSNNGKKIVFLTFDDGTSKTNTPEVLRILDENNIKATFFLTGSNIENGGYMSWKNMDELDKYLEKNNIASIDWNALNADAEGPKKNAKQLAQYAIKTSEGKEMVVLLMHDTYGKEETVKALPTIIKYFKDNGYEFRTLV